MDNLTSRQSVAVSTAVMPNLVPKKVKPSFNKICNDFIRHPHQFPLEYRRRRGWRWSSQDKQAPAGDLGLSFTSRKYIPTGTKMEISIPLRGDAQKFQGTVVMVREVSNGYEIGLWLASADDASRARIVEQICHLECSLKAKDEVPRPRVRRKPRAHFPAGISQPLPS